MMTQIETLLLAQLNEWRNFVVDMCDGYAREVEHTHDVELGNGVNNPMREVQAQTARHLAKIFKLQDFRKRAEVEACFIRINKELEQARQQELFPQEAGQE